MVSATFTSIVQQQVDYVNVPRHSIMIRRKIHSSQHTDNHGFTASLCPTCRGRLHVVGGELSVVGGELSVEGC